jgi:hypothetical protein
MKAFLIALASVPLLVSLAHAASAPAKHDLYYCQKLAWDRGFTDQILGGNRRNRKIFIRNCMNGTQQ